MTKRKNIKLRVVKRNEKTENIMNDFYKRHEKFHVVLQFKSHIHCICILQTVQTLIFCFLCLVDPITFYGQPRRSVYLIVL